VETILRCFLVPMFLAAAVPANAVTAILPAHATADESAFVASLQDALETTNIPALVSLCYCEEDEPWAQSFYFRQVVQHPCDLIQLVRNDSPEAAGYNEQLTGSHSVLPVQWWVVLRQPPLLYEATGTNLTVLPASLFNGRIVITQRMAAFSPGQKQFIMAGAGLAALLALWYAAKFVRLRFTVSQLRYSPAGLAFFLVCFAAECLIFTQAMSSVAPHPLRLLILPLVGLSVLGITVIYDEWSKAGQTMSARLKAAGPLVVFFGIWKAWRERTGLFASPTARAAVLAGAAVIAGCFGIYVWKGVSIVLSPQHVQGIVTRCEPKGGVQYAYTVNGKKYAGSGVGSFDRSYPVGSPLDVKYSGYQPAYSTIENDPFLFIEQLTCGFVIMAGFSLLATTKKASIRE
jgi:hypothetical protein